MQDIVIGIDIGGTNTEFGLINRKGEILISGKFYTPDYEEAEQLVVALSDKIKNLAKPDEYDLKGIGIGVPNGNYYKGTVEYAANLRWHNYVPLVEMFNKHFPDIKTILTNDANAAAIGEKVFGAAKDMKHFVVITLGTGLGSGIFINGNIYHGNDGFAGEIGHTIYDYEGRNCNCGRRGCLETYVSASGIKRTVAELISSTNIPSTLRDVPNAKLSGKLIEVNAQVGDKLALKAFNYTAEILGKHLANIVAYLNPEAIFLLGGLSNAGDLLFKPVEYHLNQNLLYIYKNKVKILPSGISDGNAAIIGAAALAWSEISII
jgi:glucokinase